MMSFLEPYLMWIKIAVLALVFGAGWQVNQWRWEAAVADQKQEAARVLQVETEKVLAAERNEAKVRDELEKAYVERSQERAKHSLEAARLSDDLHAAVERVRLSGRGEGGGRRLPTAPGTACRCDGVEAARDQLAAALERLAAGGNVLIEEGQHAVDVALACKR